MEKGNRNPGRDTSTTIAVGAMSGATTGPPDNSGAASGDLPDANASSSQQRNRQAAVRHQSLCRKHRMCVLAANMLLRELT